MEKVVRLWKGLPGRCWSPHPWRSSRKEWVWCSVLWAGDKEGIRHRLDSVVFWNLFSNLNDSVIPGAGCLMCCGAFLWDSCSTEGPAPFHLQGGCGRCFPAGQKVPVHWTHQTLSFSALTEIWSSFLRPQHGGKCSGG